MGPFCASDSLFMGIPRDFQMYTMQQICSLKSTSTLDPQVAQSHSISSKLSSSTSAAQAWSIPTMSDAPNMKIIAPKVEPDSTSNVWAGLSSSEGHWDHPLAAAVAACQQRDLLTEITMSNASCATKTGITKEITKEKGTVTMIGNAVTKGNKIGTMTVPWIMTETSRRDMTTVGAASAAGLVSMIHIHSLSPLCGWEQNWSRTPEHFTLPAPLVFHSTPMTIPCHMSSDIHGVL